MIVYSHAKHENLIGPIIRLFSGFLYLYTFSLEVLLIGRNTLRFYNINDIYRVCGELPLITYKTVHEEVQFTQWHSVRLFQ